MLACLPSLRPVVNLFLGRSGKSSRQYSTPPSHSLGVFGSHNSDDRRLIGEGLNHDGTGRAQTYIVSEALEPGIELQEPGFAQGIVIRSDVEIRR